MSWLVVNWFGVCVIFGAPAAAGVIGWVVRSRTGGETERRARARDRERETARHVPHLVARPPRPG